MIDPIESDFALYDPNGGELDHQKLYWVSGDYFAPNQTVIFLEPREGSNFSLTVLSRVTVNHTNGLVLFETDDLRIP